MEIESISFMIEDYYSSYKDTVYLYLALTDLDELTDTFDSNFIPGTRQLVLYVDTLYYGTEPDQWFTVDFQYPFWYSGEENLLIELISPHIDGGYSDVYNWDSGALRSLVTYNISQQTGIQDFWVPYMILSGTMELSPGTFGSIKILFGNL